MSIIVGEKGGKEATSRRMCKVIQRELGDVPTISMATDNFVFGVVDKKGERHTSFQVRSLNGFDEEIIESNKNTAQKYIELCKGVVTRIGPFEDPTEIKKIVEDELSYIDLIKIVYSTRCITLGNVFKYKTICDGRKDQQFCAHVSEQLGDMSSIQFGRRDEKIIDQYDVDIDGVEYSLKRMNGARQIRMKADVDLFGRGLDTAIVAGRLHAINKKIVADIDAAKRLDLLHIKKLKRFIDEEMDEGYCDDVFVHECKKCGHTVKRELELDSDFFSLAE